MQRLRQRPFVARVVAWLSTPEALGFLFLVGWLIRLWLATQGVGMKDDLDTFNNWVTRLVQRGPGEFYPTDPGDSFFIDYPPGYLYVLWALGLIAKALGGTPTTVWLKGPGMIGDLVLAWLVGIAAERMRDRDSAVPARFLGSAAILLNPAFIFLSAVWGQIDSVLGALLLGALLLVGTGSISWRREIAGMAVFGVAVGTKPQALFVAPAIAAVLFWRHVYGREGDGRSDRARPAWLHGATSLVALGFVALGTVFVLFVPFGLSPLGAADFYRNISGTYPYTGVFAFNLWGANHFWRPAALYWLPDSGPDAFRVLGVPALYCGIFAVTVLGAYVVYRTWSSLRRGEDEARTLFFAALALSLVAFALLTRVHERYLFAPLALGAAFVSIRRTRIVFAVGSVFYLLMLWFAFVFWQEIDLLPVPKLGGLYDALFGDQPDGLRMRVYSFVTGASCVIIAVAGWAVVRRRRSGSIDAVPIAPPADAPG